MNWMYTLQTVLFKSINPTKTPETCETFVNVGSEAITIKEALNIQFRGFIYAQCPPVSLKRNCF